MTARLQIDGLAKRLGDRAVLDGVSFDVAPQEFVAVLGPSGAGKTTLFRCIAGLARPDAGAIRLDGQTMAGLRGRRLAVVFQQFNLVPRLTALDNVLAGRLGHAPLWRGVLRMFTRADRLLALECLDRVGLLDHALSRADRLSGGQQQRVAIARALAQEPDVILADEPVASLDPASALQVLDLLRSITRSEGTAVLCSLHQTDYARSHADRIIGLAHGRVTLNRPAAECNGASLSRLYQGTSDEPR